MTEKLPPDLRDITPIRENQRFGTYRAIAEDGSAVFVKQVRHPKLATSLRREMYGLERISQLARMHDFPFGVPKIIANGSDYLVTTWAEGRTMLFSAETPDLAERVDFLAASYAKIDQATEVVRPGRAGFAIPGDKQLPVARRLEMTLGSIDHSHYFDPELIKKSIDYLETNLPHLTARFTHADFTPNNVIEDAEGHRVLIDWESASELWPRFYDIVNFTFNRALAQPELRDSLKEVAYRAFEKIGQAPEAHLRQLNTIAAVRALSSIGELMTEPNDYHNTTDTMDDTRAKLITETLEKVLRGDSYI